MDGRAENKPARTVSCPICAKAAVYAPSNRFRPFCSERCRLIDLGQWATESYRVPVDQSPNDDNLPTEEKD